VPIIVLSGLNDTTVALNAVHQGAQDYLIKARWTASCWRAPCATPLNESGCQSNCIVTPRSLREKNAQLESDFNMAREIQQIFLPDQYPTFPRFGGSRRQRG